MKKNLRERKATTTDDDAVAEAAAATVPALEAVSVAAAPANAQAKRKKYPCGNCNKEVTGRCLCCQVCEYWYHADCVPGMTKEYFDNCNMTKDLIGHSAFLCHVCQKVVAKFKSAMKDMEEKMLVLENRVTVLELEKETLAEKVVSMEMKTSKVEEGLEGVEKEVVNGMEKAKEEVKKDMGREMKEREERSLNVVFYGVEESKAAEVEARKNEEKERVVEVIGCIGVELKEEVEIKFRAGKMNEGAGEKPRPLIVRINDDETRERILKDSRKLARSAAFRSVFVSQDLTWAQREEARKEEKQLRELADKKTEESKNEGKRGRYLVVGQRGRRRIVWTEWTENHVCQCSEREQ